MIRAWAAIRAAATRAMIDLEGQEGPRHGMNEKTIDVVLEQRMLYRASTGSGHMVLVDDGIGNKAPRPTELVLIGLATCTAMDVISICRKKRQKVTHYEIHLHAVARAEYPQVFTRIDIVHELTGPNISEEAVRRSVELSATKYCPVSAMLSAGATEIHHRYRILGASDQAVTAEAEVIVTGPNQPPDIVD